MSWGTTWGARWGGGAAAPAPPAAAATSTVTGSLAIIQRFQAAIVATGAGLQLANPRYPLELAPEAGSHRRFEVRLTAGRIARQYFGAGKAFLGATAIVRVAYLRPGGDAGGGDRTSVNIQAGEDATLIADALTESRNWDRNNTGIRMVTLDRGAALAVDAPKREIYEARLAVEHEVPWPLSVTP